MGHISNFRVELKRDYQRGLYTQPAEILNWITFAEVLGKHLLFLFFLFYEGIVLEVVGE